MSSASSINPSQANDPTPSYYLPDGSLLLPGQVVEFIIPPAPNLSKEQIGRIVGGLISRVKIAQKQIQLTDEECSAFCAMKRMLGLAGKLFATFNSQKPELLITDRLGQLHISMKPKAS
jgi:hypothetical protein